MRERGTERDNAGMGVPAPRESSGVQALKKPAASTLLEGEPQTSVWSPHLEYAPRPALDRICRKFVANVRDLDHRHPLVCHSN